MRSYNLRHEKGKPKHFKYGKTLKHLIPYRSPPKNKDVLPSRYAGLFSYISVSWLSPLMWKAYKRKFKEEDLWSLPSEEGARVNGDRIQKLWKEELLQAKKTKRKPRLWRATWRFCRTRMLLGPIIMGIVDILALVGLTVFLYRILEYISSPETDHMYGLSLFLGKIIISTILPIIFFNCIYLLGIYNSTRLAGALQAMIYRKMLTLKTGGEELTAQVINLCTNDLERVIEAVISCVFILEIPVYFFSCLGYTLYTFGPLSAVGFGVYLLFYPIIALIAQCQGKIREKTIHETDRRVGLMSEILNSIRLIKMYAWEEPFAKKIAGIRYYEMKKHRAGALLNSMSNTLMPSTAILATIATLLSFTLAGIPITSAQAFTTLSLFNIMSTTVSLVPYIIRCFAEAAVALSRMESILVLPEHRQTAASEDNAAFAIEIRDANYSWEVISVSKEDGDSGEKNRDGSQTDSPSLSKREQKIQLKDKESAMDSTSDVKRITTLFQVNLTINHGKLIGVCGSICSGKSSLISAICGDMSLDCGEMFVNGKVALVTQQAWIYNETLRDNLLLGAAYNEEKYNDAVQYSCLQSDIDMFPAGDLTEIGDRGINLSGGQKQRVSIARAMYSDRDIYLLDDPLSAVDIKVANSIFNDCIKGYLRGKTIIFITHSLHLLEECDEIVVMRNGTISERGSHSQLLASQGDYFQMVKGIYPQEESKKKNKSNKKPEEKSLLEEEDEEEERLLMDGKLTTKETKHTGSTAWKVYRTLIQVCGGWFLAFCLLAAVLIFVLIQLFNMIWLQSWLDEGDGLMDERLQNATQYNQTLSEDELRGSIINNPLLSMYQTVYGASFIALLVVGFVKGVGITYSVLQGASNLHNTMFKSILRSPMSFFDTTPSGRILNRFSRDLDQLDIQIPFFLEFVVQGILSILAQSILLCTIYVYFTLPLVVVAILFVVCDLFLNAGIREFKRIDSTRKSFVLQHIGASLAGISVIRTFDQRELFTNRMYQYLDDHTVAELVFQLSTRWYVFRSDLISALINICITGFSIFGKGLVSTATAGLALSTMSSVTEFIPFLMEMKSEFQSRFTAVERLAEYSYELESESPSEDPGKHPPRDWPEFGKVEIKRVSLRYRPELPLILQGIEATFLPGQKIGVVGRTGAGKSSLISILLRLVEVESGSIIIDGVDISTLGLRSLRSAISVIPQDPVLFQGSIRYNLDPFETHSDAAVWEALELSNLKKIVEQQEKGLQSAVATAGENFSIGERQLICLARALLRKSKILLLDEATASVDMETDQMIQVTIREAFRQSTVITIAHRLNTILTYDRVLVLHEGKVVEFEAPEVLMSKEGSLFRDMISAVGVSTIDQMKSVS